MTLRFKNTALLCTSILAMPLLSGCGGNNDDEIINDNGSEQTTESYTGLNYYANFGKIKEIGTMSKGIKTGYRELYEYDNQQRVVSITKPSSGEIDTYEYHDDRIIFLEDSGYDDHIIYILENGRIVRAEYPSGELRCNYVYDDNNRLIERNYGDGRYVKIEWEINQDHNTCNIRKFINSDGTVLSTTPDESHRNYYPCLLYNFYNYRETDMEVDVNLLAEGYYGKSVGDNMPFNMSCNNYFALFWWTEYDDGKPKTLDIAKEPDDYETYYIWE